MIYFRQCYPQHAKLVIAQHSQRSETPYLDIADDWIAASHAMSAWINETCVAVAGYRYVWAGRAVAWALLSERAGPAMIPIVKRMREHLDACTARRVEMTVRRGFLPGARLATLLGFKCETPEGMLAFFEDGETAYLFARVRP